MYLKLTGSAPQTSSELLAAVQSANEKSDRTLTVGLDEIPSLDTPAMNGLITALRRMRNAGGTVRLQVTRPDVLQTLAQTGLDRVFRVVAAYEEPRPRPGTARKRKRNPGIRSIAGLAGAIVALLVLGAK
jgi:anti-anti-sigma factor